MPKTPVGTIFQYQTGFGILPQRLGATKANGRPKLMDGNCHVGIWLNQQMLHGSLQSSLRDGRQTAKPTA